MLLLVCNAFWILIFQIQLHYGSARQSIVKRLDADCHYVFSSREGCVSVTSLQPCTLSWPLKPYFAKLYKQKIEGIKAAVKLNNHLYGEECADALQNALCARLTPHCFEDGSQDFGDAKETCEEVYDSCPSIFTNDLKKRGFCEIMKTGKHPKSECVALSTPLKGACPQLKYKLPGEFIVEYEANSIQLSNLFDMVRNSTHNGARIFSDYCLQMFQDISCTPIFCSDDEKYLLTVYFREDCEEIVTQCLEEPMKSMSLSAEISYPIAVLMNTLKSSCNIFPTISTAQLQSESSLNSFCHRI